MIQKGMLTLMLAAAAALWGTTADAHPPVGYRVAAGSARAAYHATRVAVRVPVRTAAVAGRAYYRAARTPLYSPYRVGVYRPSAAYASPLYHPSVGYGASFRYGVGYGVGGYGCY